MGDEPVPQDEDEVDEVMFTNYLSSHFVGRSHAPTEEEAAEDFPIGGGRLYSFYVAEMIRRIPTPLTPPLSIWVHLPKENQWVVLVFVSTSVLLDP